MENIFDIINEYKDRYKERLYIPAHHYQREDIVELSDFRGDSYKLAVECSKTDAEFIVFCGVRFMAEGASILAKDNQKILIPEITAGCPMADMIDEVTAQKAYEIAAKHTDKEIIPVVYMNSYADMKNFCGIKGGTVCTSSNAEQIVNYYLKQDKAVLFFPDYNLGINTANLLNIKSNEIMSINRNLSIKEEAENDIKMILWDGYCHVHKEFSIQDIKNIKNNNPDIKIIVHPECSKDVVELSDISGSTDKIYKTLAESRDGSFWAVGTEIHFVSRIAKEFPDKKIIPLKTSPCMNMEKITLLHLLESLKSIDDFLSGTGQLKYEIKVHNDYKEGSKKALEKMIEIVSG